MVRSKAADGVVVGAGLVGMTAAALLAAEGRASRRRANPTTGDEPKAISLDDEALRVYQGASLTERILTVIVPRIGTWYFDAWGRSCSRLARAAPTGSAIRFTTRSPSRTWNVRCTSTSWRRTASSCEWRRTATSHIGLRAPDVAGATEFYARILGLTPARRLPGGGRRLGWGLGHHVLDLGREFVSPSVWVASAQPATVASRSLISLAAAHTALTTSDCRVGGTREAIAATLTAATTPPDSSRMGAAIPRISLSISPRVTE